MSILSLKTQMDPSTIAGSKSGLRSWRLCGLDRPPAPPQLPVTRAVMTCLVFLPPGSNRGSVWHSVPSLCARMVTAQRRQGAQRTRELPLASPSGSTAGCPRWCGGGRAGDGIGRACADRQAGGAACADGSLGSASSRDASEGP